MNELASAYNEFVDLKEQLAAYTEQLNNLKGVLGPEHFRKIQAEDATDIIGNTSEISPSPATMREQMPLWLALKEYLSASGECKVGEAEDFLCWLGFPNVRRQSIESALRRHPETFRVRKVGREKFISLKGA